MAVVFAQPSPMAPGITAGGGAAQQYSKDLPSLVSLYESLLRAGSGGGGGGHGGGGGGVHQDFGARGGMPAIGMGRAGASSQFQQPMSQAEKMQMARLQAAQAAVDADSTLSPDEKNQYKQLIAAGLDPLTYKLQQEKLKQQQEQTQQIHQQAALMEAIRQGNLENGAKGIGSALPQVVGADGKKHTLYFDGKTWKILESKNAQAEDADKLKNWRADQAQAAKELTEAGKEKPTRESINDRARQIEQDRQDSLNPPAKIQPDEEQPPVDIGGGQMMTERTYRRPGMQQQGPGANLGVAPVAGQQQPSRLPPNPYRKKATDVGAQLLQSANDQLAGEQETADETPEDTEE